MAPMGWQVFAGLIVSAERSTTSLLVCLKSMGTLLLPNGAGLHGFQNVGLRFG